MSAPAVYVIETLRRGHDIWSPDDASGCWPIDPSKIEVALTAAETLIAEWQSLPGVIESGETYRVAMYARVEEKR